MKIFVRLLQYIRPYRVRFALAILSSGVVSGLSAAYAWLVKPAIDEVFISKDETWLLLILGLLILVTALKGISSYAQSYLMTYVGVRVITDIRRNLFHHLMRLPMEFHHKHPSSHMLSRVINDVNCIQNSVAGVLKDLFQSSLTFVFLLATAVYLNWQLALLSIVVLPLTAYPIIQFGARMRRLATRGQERTADMSLALQEDLTGIRVVKGFSQESREDRRFGKINEAYFRTWMKSTQVSALTTPVLEAISVIGVAGIIWFGGIQVIQGQEGKTAGTFFSFLAAVIMMYGPVRRIAGANNTIQQALAAATRVFYVLDEPTEEARDLGTKEVQGVRESVELRNLSFRYDGADTLALKDINLTVRAGEVLALVGSSGAGKTTFVNLIPRFYDPTSGAIFLDGVGIRDIRLSSLRGLVGIVSQDTLLFDATISDNIAYGREESPLEAVMEAAKSAYAHEFIMRLPDGYDTLIGENGLKLSGGQRQRIAIARAILRDPPILILDEATSALDSESERMVQLALANLMKHRTTFVIAHRLTTVQHADRIAVLERGRLAELGSHDTLLRLGGLYSRLHAVQFQSLQELSR